jgi:hypothetical protein
MLVSSFNLSKSFNYTPYLFYKKWFKSEINSFCIWTLTTVQHFAANAKHSKYYSTQFMANEIHSENIPVKTTARHISATEKHNEDDITVYY